ncbi:MAG: DUF6340 family protein [Imperialibacter sp.]|uniref:DUF6340 family protein n=1 Tax=Imperialibacter sp. TaxID=2038411 RepID=UPI003A87645B
MKLTNHTLKLLVALLAISLAASSCTKSVYINTLRPAEITFPSHVNTILLVDRTEFERKGLGIMEGVLTGEMPGEDRAGVQEAMNAFQQQLMASPRFQLKRASETLKGNSMTGAFPDPISWGVIERLCRNYDADAVIAVEIFDTDFIVTNGKRDVEREVEKDGKKVMEKVVEYYAEGVGNAKIGFRLYDPLEKTIADQQLFNPSNNWSATGANVKDAVSQLIQKTEATRQVSRTAGSTYAYKIAPMPVQLSRFYYAKSKKTPEVRQGARQAQVGQWQGAIDTWRGRLSQSIKRKEGGKLAYNIAVAYEVLGDFDSAKEWASRSYVKYENKKGRGYNSTLNQRIYNDQLLQQQGVRD